jgi:hypothetical protein
MGEQPNPWDLLQPQDATSRHRGAKPCRRCDALQFLAGQTIPLSLSRQWRLMEAIDLAVAGSRFHLSHKREVVTGEACIAYLERIPDLARSDARSNYDKHPSLGITHRMLSHFWLGLHRYEPLFTAQSLGRGATLTLGQDQPVIPGVAFIR